MDDDSAEWFTTAEVAAVVLAAGATDELPGTASGLKRWIKRQAAAHPDSWLILGLVDLLDGRHSSGQRFHLWPLTLAVKFPCRSCGQSVQKLPPHYRWTATRGHVSVVVQRGFQGRFKGCSVIGNS
ncbi:hypothetical protein [Rhodovulum steppense]|uniref:Uncharacterized protein n=1 Tax=Rhodovulum steppense TaxID=540251 RepID=A0A4R1YZ39_9RHOB|nr:hypothetical protein [Rhodovulum steppense]TCM86562.1 hypothetical protein EV216_104114 [Rhodovulum steppense]